MIDLTMMVPSMAVVLIIIVEGMVVVDKDMVTNTAAMAVEGDRMLPIKEEILTAVAMAVMRTIEILEIIAANSNQIMDPQRGAGLVEEALAVPILVVMDLGWKWCIRYQRVLKTVGRGYTRQTKELSGKLQVETTAPNALEEL